MMDDRGSMDNVEINDNGKLLLLIGHILTSQVAIMVYQ